MYKILRKSLLTACAVLMTVSLLVGCGGSNSASTGSTGTLSVALTDAATENYQAVYVTIDRIDVYSGEEESDTGSWVTVAEPGETYNLLALVNGVFAELGQELLGTGAYGQLRLIIGATAEVEQNIQGNQHPYANYVIDSEDQVHELKIPSGPQTGIKIIHGFEIFAGQMTELVLDFDASRSVVKAGSSGLYLLKPTIKILDVVNMADVYGTVTEAVSDPIAPVPGAFVSAQTTADTAEPVEDQVTIEAGTVTTEAGEYALVLDPGSYNIVVSAAGYELACNPVSTVEGGASTAVDFSLVPLSDAPATISGEVIFPATEEGAEELYAVLSVRQELMCGAAEETAIAQSEQVAAGGSYEFTLPVGEYTIVATANGFDTKTETVTISSEGTIPENPLDFDFTTP